MGDVRTWQLDCLAMVAAQRPARLAGFRAEVGAIQSLPDDGSATAGSLIRLDQAIASWVLVIDWLRRLD
ncbi:MAG TPA: hypothetical protein VKR24_12815 [Candidatus Limnocylindrales bacterium]|nr:hypothetical protein [Candidatus Limnocylindrales bacterium]